MIPEWQHGCPKSESGKPDDAVMELETQLEVGGAHNMTVSWRGAAGERFERG
jgi:hypothetical protein